MDAYMLVLRLIHIFTAILWAGWTFSFVSFLQPMLRGMGPDGGKFMQALMKTRLPLSLTIAAALNILSGVLLYWRDSGHLQPAWITSGTGLAFTIGGLAGLAAFAVGLTISKPAGDRMAVLVRDIEAGSGPPTPEQVAEVRRLQARLATGGLWIAVLLAVAVAGMSVARYVWLW